MKQPHETDLAECMAPDHLKPDYLAPFFQDPVIIHPRFQ
jgi:hypothetical protein